MKRRLALLLTLLLAQSPASAQQQQPAPVENDEEDVVRITSNLVQFDAVVTDKKGRLVTDLKPEDFEVSIGGRKQEITNFSFVLNETPTTPGAQPSNAAPRERAAPVVPPARLRPEQVHRTIALVVDDLGTSYEDIISVRRALKNFVDEQMQPGDLVAILRTAAGMGALQQFTNDKRLLYAAIERVRWNPSHGSINTFAPVTTDPINIIPQAAGPGSLDPSLDRPPTQLDRLRQEVFAIGTLGALGFAVRGLKSLPGRKSVVLFSDALRIYNREQTITRVQDALDNLIDLANRAAVSFYTVDARGLQTLTPTAQDDVGGDTGPFLQSGDEGETNKLFLAGLHTGSAERRRDFFESQEGLRYLASRTGGEFVGNNNDLNRGVRRALQDSGNYYLIGFVPDEATFKGKNGSREFQNVALRV